MRATSSNLATAPSHVERVLPQSTFNMGENTPSFKTALPEPTLITNEETAPSLMKRAMDGHAVMEANKDMAGTFVESSSNAID